MLLWFQCNVTMAHVGAGKSTDRTVFIQAPDAVEAYDIALWLPGTKKSRGAIGPSVQPWRGRPPRNSWRWYWKKK